VFEITETAAIGNLDAAQRLANTLSSLGCRLALDDFGTGFGSFTYLRSLPVDYLKIDSSFVLNLVDSPEDQAVVRSMVHIAESFGRSTVAEGVENQATLGLLFELGVDYVQGYFTGRPVPVLA
jgi:EAL domain-containing protein (putative c-di-GMP-specific phosphodiesterase class I)